VFPLKDSVPTRATPILTIGLIVVNVLMWILYQDAGQGAGFEASINELAYHPCEVENSCRTVGQDWPVTTVTSMFMHGSWLHLGGNMLFLWIFGNNVEDVLGKIRYLVFYLLAGFAATAAQTFVTLGYGSPQDGEIPNLGASGAIAGVLGAYLLLFPRGRVLTWMLPFFLFEIPAFIYLGLWFVFQLIAGGSAFVAPADEETGGIAYFAHIGGFVFGFLAVKLFSTGRPPRYEASY
jgi:membrane associated rhomboid family serine protease